MSTFADILATFPTSSEEDNGENSDDEDTRTTIVDEELNQQIPMEESEDTDIEVNCLFDDSDNDNNAVIEDASDEDVYIDPLEPPRFFDISNEHSQTTLAKQNEILGAWIYKHTEEVQKTGQTFITDRIKYLKDKWIEFMIVNDAHIREAVKRRSHQDHYIFESFGSNIFINLMNLNSLLVFRQIIEGRARMSQYVERLILKYGDDDDRMDVTSPLFEFSEETVDFGICVNFFRVTHLGPNYAHWISDLDEKTYTTDLEMISMKDSDWFLHVLENETISEKKKRRKKAPPPYKAKDKLNLPRFKRVVEYTQNEVIRALKLLSRDIHNESPSWKSRIFFQILMWKIGRFFSASHPVQVMNVDNFRETRTITTKKRIETVVAGVSTVDFKTETSEIIIFNRLFMLWIFYYTWPIIKLWYFHDLYSGEHIEFAPRFRSTVQQEIIDRRWLNKKNLKRTSDRFMNRHKPGDIIGVSNEEVKTVISWIKETLLPGLGDEGFNKCYEETAKEVYRFPGDSDYFKIVSENSPDNTSTLLVLLRQEDPNIYNRFLQELSVSLPNVVGGVGYSYMNDRFVLNAIGSRVSSHVDKNLDWLDTYVIDADWLEKSASFIQTCELPMLICFFDKYYVMFEERIYRTKSTIESITLWFKIVDIWFSGALTWETDRQGQIKPRLSLKNMLDEIWRKTDLYEELGNGLYDKPI